jgi:microcin C transport system substrate-binding protein
MYGQYFLHRSYFEDLYSPARPCPHPLIEFRPARAAELLDRAGWTVDPGTGLRAKDGRTLSIRFLTRSSSSDKFLAIYKEDLRDAGVELSIERKDWAAWAKDMDRYDFDMTWAAWGASVRKDPESMWLSTEADRPSGNNITGFRDEAVDALIAEQRVLFDIEARHEICRTIDAILVERLPYILLWNIDYTRLLYWNRFGMPETVLSKYGNESSAVTLWWLDSALDAELERAMREGAAMPPPPAEIRYDDVGPE